MMEGHYPDDDAERRLACLRDATLAVTKDPRLVPEEERIHQMYMLLWKRSEKTSPKQVAALAEEVEPVECRVLGWKARELAHHALLRDYHEALVPLERAGSAIELRLIEIDEKKSLSDHEEFTSRAKEHGIEVPPFSNLASNLDRAMIKAREAAISVHHEATQLSQFAQKVSLDEFRRRRRWHRIFLWLAGFVLVGLNIVISTFLCELINEAFKLDGWINFGWQVAAAVVVFCLLEFPFFRKWQRKLSMIEWGMLRMVLRYLGYTERSLVYEEAGTMFQFREINRKLYRFRSPPEKEEPEEEVA